jgi:hypothetical protein
MMLLRNSRTGQFFSNSGWTHNTGLAHRFADISSALEICNRYQFKDAELVAASDFEELGPGNFCSPSSLQPISPIG